MIRKIIKIGNSEGVTIPVATMRALKLKAGDKIEVYIGELGGDLRRFELLGELDKFYKQYGQTLKNLNKK